MSRPTHEQERQEREEHTVEYRKATSEALEELVVDVWRER